MKTKSSYLLIPLTTLLLLVVGCYSTKYMPYAGQQQEWPTAPGSFIATNALIPTYYGYPPRPYTMLAQIQVDTQNSLVNTVQVAARVAKEKGADAICVIENDPHFTGSVGSGVANNFSGFTTGVGASAATYASNAKVIAIKFK